jgi:hypothetical protein
MFHPVGHQSSSVYWRRRLFLIASVIALIGLIAVSAHVALSTDPAKPAAGTSGQTTPHTTTSTPPATHGTSQHATTTGSPTGSGTPTGSGSSSVVAVACTASQLVVQAKTSQPEYSVGTEPVLMLQVTDKSTVPCTQNLADSQIVMRVYNGVSRVWGSHDCTVQPGTDVRTLAVGQPVQISIVWSGLSSQAKCAGTRQRVGAGTYTLYVSLSGHDGTAAQFALK